ncbi:MAG: aspartate aminotransferase family protein [Betaproteobacteria bacterium]|nr:aspartate aminotransferase family protein [Betaproteobacteria bacterium]
MNDRARSPLSPAQDIEHSAFFMPYTANREFKKAPRMLERAEGMYYWTPEGRKVLDGTSGLWCVNAGHCRPKIAEAIAAQAKKLDFAPAFQMGHPIAFEFAERLAEIAPKGIGHVFYTNSGSESADTALKLALAYHRARGEAGRYRLFGRERGYHGVNFGGMSVGGIVSNRKTFGAAMLPGVDHIRHTHDPARNLMTRGQPVHGGIEFADDLERLVALHDASSIAAVIVEPVAGSTGVLIPPVGYLQRLREICTKHGILLIFDEVITGFGRLGTPFATDYFGVKPDMITCAKGITNAAIPMGAVLLSDAMYDTFMQGPGGMEFFHGYTYSGHPMACAAGIATLDVYAEEGLLTRAATLAKYWEDAIWTLKDAKNVVDLRVIGLVAGIELSSRAGAVGARAFECFTKAFEKGVLIRVTGETIAVSPPLIIEKPQIDQIVSTLAEAIKAVA